MKPNWTARVLVATVAAGLAATGCSGDDGGTDATTTVSEAVLTAPASTVQVPAPDAAAVVATYADWAHAVYSDAVTAVEEMRVSLGALVATPSEATLAGARQSWLLARDAYGSTEVLRHYDGPIDAPGTGPERRIDGWPVDEEGIEGAGRGLVDDPDRVPELTADAVVAAAALEPEAPVVTGWHAIELLLWGPDTAADGPGSRPATDFASAPHAARRGTLLLLLADRLGADLASVRDQWAPSGPYRATFLADPHGSLGRILRGMAALSRGDLADARITAALEAGDERREQSPYSDNSVNDLVAALRGARMAYTAEHERVSGPSLSSVVGGLVPGLDADLRKLIANNLAAAEAVPGRFDQAILAEDDDPGRAELLELAADLRAQADTCVALAAALGLRISGEV